MDNIRVLIVDDHAVLRDGIRSMLERQTDIIVAGEAANGRQAISKVSELLPDIVLMDVAMPDMNGIEATRQIKSLYPQVKILVLTQHDNREYVAALLQAGASGYTLKRSGGRELINAIHHVSEQGAFLEPGITQHVLDEYKDTNDIKSKIPHLTEREQQILKLVVSGVSTKEIAQSLGISPKTVSVHRSNLMMKLGVQNSFELIRFAAQHGLVEINLSSGDE
jgi:RNA polymerase sigma factor (sigma-70 family)